MSSPYQATNREEWMRITRELVGNHPLDLATIRDVGVRCWDTLWRTKIGEGTSAISLNSIEVPSTVVGYFFERLFAHELAREFPESWRGGRSKGEKDFVYLVDDAFSVEMKASGQLGTKVFGNRSYGQQGQEGNLVTKVEKSGYYITVNFYRQTLILLRFGWIDFEDWRPQGSETGQSATLPDYVYEHKLVQIPGAYRLAAPVSILRGVGPRKTEVLAREGVEKIGQLLEYRGSDRIVLGCQESAEEFLGELPNDSNQPRLDLGE